MQIIGQLCIHNEVVAMLYFERDNYFVSATINTDSSTYFIPPKNEQIVIEDFIHIIQHELNKKKMRGGIDGWT